MKNKRGFEILIGVLFILATVSYMIGSEMTEGAIRNFSESTPLDATAIRIGVVLEWVNSAAVIGIAVLLYRLLRARFEGTAILYLVTRLTEAILLLLCSTVPLVLLATGSALLMEPVMSWRSATFQFGMIALAAGSLFLCYVLYSAKLIPRILSLIGMIGYLALFINGWLVLFGGTGSMLLYAPGAVFEIAFPIWLFVKGLKMTEHPL